MASTTLGTRRACAHRASAGFCSVQRRQVDHRRGPPPPGEAGGRRSPTQVEGIDQTHRDQRDHVLGPRRPSTDRVRARRGPPRRTGRGSRRWPRPATPAPPPPRAAHRPGHRGGRPVEQAGSTTAPDPSGPRAPAGPGGRRPPPGRSPVRTTAGPGRPAPPVTRTGAHTSTPASNTASPGHQKPTSRGAGTGLGPGGPGVAGGQNRLGHDQGQPTHRGQPRRRRRPGTARRHRRRAAPARPAGPAGGGLVAGGRAVPCPSWLRNGRVADHQVEAPGRRVGPHRPAAGPGCRPPPGAGPARPGRTGGPGLQRGPGHRHRVGVDIGPPQQVLDDGGPVVAGRSSWRAAASRKAPPPTAGSHTVGRDGGPNSTPVGGHGHQSRRDGRGGVEGARSTSLPALEGLDVRPTGGVVVVARGVGTGVGSGRGRGGAHRLQSHPGGPAPEGMRATAPRVRSG